MGNPVLYNLCIRPDDFFGGDTGFLITGIAGGPKQGGYHPDHILEAIIIIGISGLLGSRALFVILQLELLPG